MLAQDDGRLLSLYDGDGILTSPDQVETEETMERLMFSLRQMVAAVQQCTHPGGILPFIAVAVGVVVHHLTVMETALMVDLPEDHPTLCRGAQSVTIGGVEHLLEREIATTDECLTELAAD